MNGGEISDRSAERVAFLLEELDEPSEGRADEATAELIAAGDRALEPLLGRVETLGRLGQLCAIEIFEALSAVQAIPALTGMLTSEDATVREWAARALGGLGAQDAVPRLRELLLKSRTRGTPPDWTEPVAIRHALTKLGARNLVIPKELGPRIVEDEQLSLAVPDDSLEDALLALKDAGLVVLYFQRWRPWKDTWTRIDGETWELDWSSPWTTLLAESNQLATQAAQARTTDDSAIVTIEWMTAEDWPHKSQPSTPGRNDP